MARPRKPTAALKLSGAFAKNPKRRRIDPQTSGPIGEVPPTLPLELHATWYELSEHAPINVLRSADRGLLETATRLFFRIRKNLDIEPAIAAQFIKCLAAMGMTPVDRSKVHAPQEKLDNPFAKFAGKAVEARKPVH